MNFLKIAPASFLATIAFVSSSLAGPITVPNFSFELNGPGYTTPTDWTRTTVSGGEVFSSNAYISNAVATGKTGNQFVQLNVDNLFVPAAFTENRLTNTASLGTFAANTTYTLTVSLANGGGGASDWSSIIRLLGNSGAVAAELNTVSSALAYNSFSDFSLVLNTASAPSWVGQSIYVQLVNSSKNINGREALFDNVRLNSVPEPATWALLAGTGTFFMVMRRRRLG